MVRSFFISAVRNVLLIFKYRLLARYCVVLTDLDVDSVQIAFH